MAVSIAATPSLRGLTALLFAAALNTSLAAADGATKGRDLARLAADASMSKRSARRHLAQIVEKRGRDLYQGKAAPFKDLQQAEAQLASTESDMLSTDTAFAASRIRLHILGRTDAEISELEQRGTISRITRITAPIDGTVIARKVGPGQYVKADTGDAL